MSISPQSLAKTRDKRSLRMPSRFNDFREIPTEVAYREVAEALNIKGKDRASQVKELLESPESKRQTPELRNRKSASRSSKRSSSKKSAASGNKRLKSNEDLEASGPSTSADIDVDIDVEHSSGESRDNSKDPTLKSVRSNSPSTRPPTSDEDSVPEKPDTKNQNRPNHDGTSSDSSLSTADLVISESSDEDCETIITSPAKSSDLTVKSEEGSAKIVREKAVSPTEPPEKRSEPPTPQLPPPKANISDYSRTKTEQATTHSDSKIENVSVEITKTTVEKLDTPAATTKKAQSDSNDWIVADEDGPKKERDDLIKFCSTFHPSIVFKKKQLSDQDAQQPAAAAPKPLIEQKPNSPIVPENSQPAVPNKSSLNKKKTKGLSLMAKPSRPHQPANPAQQQQPQQNLQHSARPLQQAPTPNTSNIQRTIQHQFLAPHAKHLNAFTSQPSIQYGTRLLLNEPIYLPRSVGTIAPITTNLQQIVAQARRPPFLTKRQEACLKYQSELKFSQMTTMHTSLVTIAKMLCVRDRLTLRLVSKAWKSIIDSDEVWKTVYITNYDSAIDFISLGQSLELKAKHVIIDGFNFHSNEKISMDSSSLPKIHYALSVMIKKLKYVQRITVKTLDAQQNLMAYVLMEACCSMNLESSKSEKGKLEWFVHVNVDDQGLAVIPYHDVSKDSIDGERNLRGSDTTADFHDSWDHLRIILKKDRQAKFGARFQEIHMEPI